MKMNEKKEIDTELIIWTSHKKRPQQRQTKQQQKQKQTAVLSSNCQLCVFCACVCARWLV